MRSIVALALGLALAISAGSALAAPADGKPVPTEGRHEGKHAKKFPMTAAAFKLKVDTRLAGAKKKMEARVAKLPADKAKEVRARFDTRAAKINAEVAKVIADGTVTKEEAKQVRQVSREGRKGKHGKGKHGQRGQHGQGKGKPAR